MNPDPEQRIRIPAGTIELEGNLTIPDPAVGIVLFAHGSGSSRHSPRNRRVAEQLRQVGLATLLMDLLTAQEEEVDRQTAALRFDIRLLAERICQAADWLARDERTCRLPTGYFGASTGAAAALVAAAERPAGVAAVVSRGGRGDLAGAALAEVRAPTLLIVGGLDSTVLELNRQAMGQLRCPHELVIVPGATHLFEESGALEEVAGHAVRWFLRHMHP